MPENQIGNQRVATTLLVLRLSVFLLMAMWTIDKFVRPEHAALVYEKFYLIGGLGKTLVYLVGAVESVVLIGFVIGYQKRLTYGAVFLFHAISTLSSYRQYLAPFQEVNLLFFAAWPALAACFALYYLRDFDTRCALSK